MKLHPYSQFRILPLDACETSQFEQHLRTVWTYPWATQPSTSGQVNLLGYEYAQNDYLPKRQQLASLPQVHVHWYGRLNHALVARARHRFIRYQNQSEVAYAFGAGKAIAQTIESIWYRRDD